MATGCFRKIFLNVFNLFDVLVYGKNIIDDGHWPFSIKKNIA